MALAKLLVVIAFFYSSCAAMVYRTANNSKAANNLNSPSASPRPPSASSSSHITDFDMSDDPCDFTDVQLDDEMFSKLPAKLPEGLEYGPQKFHSLFRGIEVGGITLHGLSKLRQFGPPIPYCAKGKRMVQVDFYNGEPIEFTSPWKTCSGQGQLVLRTTFLRFTAQFTIVESSGEGLKLEFERSLPVTTQNIRVVVKGAWQIVLYTVEALSALIPSVLEEAWNKEFSYNLARAFDMALE